MNKNMNKLGLENKLMLNDKKLDLPFSMFSKSGRLKLRLIAIPISVPFVILASSFGWLWYKFVFKNSLSLNALIFISILVFCVLIHF